ncbi:alpha/beta-hydrolase [Stipitochalara longipes BDJ]|nr:alpha/beta-hydrolase [Stipitochalara longipes BDJ]
MASKQTHTFKVIGPLSLRVDIYTLSSSSKPPYHPDSPIVLWLHGGGFVAADRSCLPPHIVQSCLSRNWPLVSADYRKLPQTSGTEAFEDVKDAYQFVVEKVPALLGENSRCERIVVMGTSAGAYFSLLCGHNVSPRPIAILTYGGIPSISVPFFNSSKIMGPPGKAPMQQAQIQAFLDEAASIGSTPNSRAFHSSSLNSNLSRNLEFVMPKDEEGKGGLERLALVPWYIQTNAYSKKEMLGEVDKKLGDERWKDFPGTVLVHGEKDVVVPYELDVELSKVIGPTPAKLFTAKGQNHNFEVPLFLGDPGLAVVEEAWAALDEIVKSKG